VPGLTRDALQQWRAATTQLGLPLHCHYSGIWDKAAGKKFGEADWETMMGVQTSAEKDAVKTERLVGDRATHVYGDTYTRTRGNTSAYTWGNSYTAFMGAKEDLLFGQTLTTSLSHKTDIQMGGREDVYLGFNFWRLNIGY
jgi:hypothetical protein